MILAGVVLLGAGLLVADAEVCGVALLEPGLGWGFDRPPFQSATTIRRTRFWGRGMGK
jgi:hypothetical protein